MPALICKKNMSKHTFFSLDMPIVSGLVLLCLVSLIVLYSAGGENLDLLNRHAIRIGFAFFLMLLFARISPRSLLLWSPYVYVSGLLLLLIVLAVGFTGNGAQRWIDLGIFRFQPSEIMKLSVPMMVAWLVTQSTLPPSTKQLFLAFLVVLIPTTLVIMQPDLGTALLIASTGLVVIFLAGISWKIIASVFVFLIVSSPVIWLFILYDFQKKRILTLFNPWDDPLNSGYHAIQSTIAIGSGGITGKGWLAGTQSQLDFIPERSTDFVFAVFAEEFGLIGVILLLLLYIFLVYRGLAIAFYARDTYARLLAGSLSITFFFYVFVNIAMVSGVAPVVGVPLPLISYGGTSMVTMAIGFGMLMSINAQKAMIARG